MLFRSPYTEVINQVQATINQPEYWKQTTIVLDATGGNVFLDHLRAARLGAQIIPVLITAGHQSSESGGKHHVPKQDLIANLEALFRERRIWLPAPALTPARQRGDTSPASDHLKQLIQELHAFERLPGPQGKATFSGKATSQDDLVIALALAAWRAVKTRPDLNHNKGIWGTQRLL